MNNSVSFPHQETFRPLSFPISPLTEDVFSPSFILQFYPWNPPKVWESQILRDLSSMYKNLIGGNEEGEVGLFPVVPTGRTRGSGHKLKHIKFQLNTRRCFHCEGGQTGCPEILQLWRYHNPNQTRRQTAACCSWPCLSKGSDWMIWRGPLQPKQSHEISFPAAWVCSNSLSPSVIGPSRFPFHWPWGICDTQGLTLNICYKADQRFPALKLYQPLPCWVMCLAVAILLAIFFRFTIHQHFQTINEVW